MTIAPARSTQLPSGAQARALLQEINHFVKFDFGHMTELLVNESSVSTDPGGLENSAAGVKLLAKSLLGTSAPVRIVRETASDGITRPYVIIGSPKPSTVLIAHHDMVKPATRQNRFDYGEGGEYFRGPGVHDDKGSIVMGLKAMDLLRRHNPEVFRKTALYVGADEEIGSEVGRKILGDLSKHATVALGLEGAEMRLELGTDQPYGIKVARKGYLKMRVTFEGTDGHAAYADEDMKRADALRATTDVLQHQVWPFIDRTKGLSHGVGKFIADNETNQVASDVGFSVEVRSWGPGPLREFSQFMTSLVDSAQAPGTTHKVETVISHDPWRATEADLSAYRAVAFSSPMRRPVEAVSVRGGGDINSNPLQFRLDGLGGMGGGDHTHDQERLLRASIPDAIMHTFMAAVQLTDRTVEQVQGLAPQMNTIVRSL